MRRIIFLILLLVSSGAYALGLGDIKVNSALNQPFDGEIALFSVRGVDLDDVKVGLAPREEFARAGLERPAALSLLRFKISTKRDGSAYIKVTSRQPIREPFLDFLLEFNWANGRLVREYTVLLDPPVMMTRAPAPVRAPTTAAAPAPTPTPKPAAAPTAPAPAPAVVAPSTEDELFPRIPIPEEDTAAAPAPTPMPAAPAAGDSYGPVGRNDTLWSIADSVRPDSGVSIQQAMMALLAENPQAFGDNNINNLKAGQVLRIPDRDAMTAMTQQEAMREARLQYEMWTSGRLQPAREPEEAPVAEEAPAAEAAAPAEAPAEAPSAEVKLVTPAEGEAGPADAGAGAGAAEAAAADLEAARKDLALASESLTAKESENTELRSRLAELEEQLDSMQRLLELKDDDLAALQRKLAEIQAEAEVVEAAVAEEAAAEPAPAEQAAPAEQIAAEPTPAEKPAQQETTASYNPYAVQEVPAPTTEAAQPVREPAPMPTEDSGGVMGMIKDNMMLVGGAAVLLLGLFGAIVLQRRRTVGAEFPESILSEKAAPAGAAAMAPSEEASLLSDFASTSVTTEAEVGEVDPLAEADVFLAYKRYAQAEEMLSGALAEEPGRQDLRLKLMEVHHATGNRGAFEALAEELHASVDEQNVALWDKAVEMGQDLAPDNPLFGDTPAEAAAAEALEEVAFEVDEELAAAVEAPAEEFEEPEEEEIAFDLDMELEQEPEPTKAAAEEGLEDLGLELGTADLQTGEPEPETAGIAAVSEEELAGLELEPMGEIAEGAVAEEAPALEEAGVSTIDEVSTKLDLARAYIDMGDPEGARSILDEVMNEGSDQQRGEAEELLAQL